CVDFFFLFCRRHRVLHSFPTRRSSDLEPSYSEKARRAAGFFDRSLFRFFLARRLGLRLFGLRFRLRFFFRRGLLRRGLLLRLLFLGGRRLFRLFLRLRFLLRRGLLRSALGR